MYAPPLVRSIKKVLVYERSAPKREKEKDKVYLVVYLPSGEIEREKSMRADEVDEKKLAWLSD